VIRYHRPLESYVRALQEAGVILDQLREARPQRERFADAAAFRRRLRVPLFLVLAGHVPVLPRARHLGLPPSGSDAADPLESRQELRSRAAMKVYLLRRQ
jgi:hypothetical protein